MVYQSMTQLRKYYARDEQHLTTSQVRCLERQKVLWTVPGREPQAAENPARLSDALLGWL